MVENFFRHEYGRIVSVLSCRVGVHHVEDVEDAVQSALMSALESWKAKGIPDNPTAWLYRVALNNLLGDLRQKTGRARILDEKVKAELESTTPAPEVFLESEMKDDLLKMLFVCCEESIPLESQLVLALKTLCGFNTREISLRLFTSEPNINKRLQRARNRLRELAIHPTDLDTAQTTGRLPSVQHILYLLFTEGHLSSNAERALRLDLCNEAIRLTSLLADNPVGQTPDTNALLALMYLHRARMSARSDQSGLLLLEEQDRSQWDTHDIQMGVHLLSESARGVSFSRYHAEAGIAAEHCMAPSFHETHWERIADCYATLEQIAPSPIHRLNRAVATAEAYGPDMGLKVLKEFEPPPWLKTSYQWAAVLSDLHRRAGHKTEGIRFQKLALESAPSAAIKELLKRRLNVKKG
ncbi:sigma-70 family RNA polymerase sigma factor [bacterium]|nr:sigma-70 family RNA polymerase sigma factor [bacterium]